MAPKRNPQFRRRREENEKPYVEETMPLKDIPTWFELGWDGHPKPVDDPDTAFEVRLKRRDIEFGDIGFSTYLEFPDGMNSNKFRGFLDGIEGDNKKMNNSDGKSISIDNINDLNGIWTVAVFGVIGCGKNKSDKEFVFNRWRVKTSGFNTTKSMNCFTKTLRSIVPEMPERAGPRSLVTLKEARDYIASKGYNVKIYTKYDKHFEADNLLLHENHFYRIDKVQNSKRDGRVPQFEKPRKSQKLLRDERAYLFFDIETIVDETKPFIYTDAGIKKTGHVLTARQLAFYYCKGETTREQDWNQVSYYGYDCIDRFLEFLREHKDTHFNIYSHNGSRFDNYFVMAKVGDLSTRKIVLMGSQIYQFRYFNHTFKDTARLMPQSLDTLCKCFKTEVAKKTSIESLGMGSYELCALSDEMLENNEELMDAYMDYCICDVIALKQVFFKYKETITKLSEGRVDVSEVNTIGKIASKMLEPEKDIFEGLKLFINDDKDKEKFVRRSVCGGVSYSRTEMEGKAYRTDKAVCGVDINSQYPAAMVLGLFPRGESRWTDNLKEIHDYPNGFMEVSDIEFNSENPKVQPIPYLNGNSYGWWYKGSKSPHVGTQVVPIGFFLYYIKPKSYTFHRALISDCSVKGEVAYGKKVDKIYDMKCLHDNYKNNGDTRYNEALRTCCKLILNSYYGKQVEGFDKRKNIVWTTGTGSKKMGVESYDEERCNKVNNMIHVGAIILSKSKQLLFEYMKCMPDEAIPFAIETDGFYFENQYYPQFKENVADRNEMMDDIGDMMHLDSTDLGGLKLEKVTIEGQFSYTIGKKCYFLPTKTEYGDDNAVMKAKTPELLNRMSDMRMSSIPVFEYDNGVYKFVIHPDHYERMYNGERINYSWNKLCRDLPTLSIVQVTQTRTRGFVA